MLPILLLTAFSLLPADAGTGVVRERVDMVEVATVLKYQPTDIWNAEDIQTECSKVIFWTGGHIRDWVEDRNQWSLLSTNELLLDSGQVNYRVRFKELRFTYSFEDTEAEDRRESDQSRVRLGGRQTLDEEYEDYP